MITVPTSNLHKNYNLVCEALETARLEEYINRPKENDGILVIRVKTMKQFNNMVEDLREIEAAIGKTLHVYDTPANLPKFKDMILSLTHINDGKGVKAEGDSYNMKRFLTMPIIGFSWRNPSTLAPWKPNKKPHFYKGQKSAWTWQRALEKGLTQYPWAKDCNPQAFLTEEEKARGVKGAWLIVQASGEDLKLILENLNNLCEHWGWNLDFGTIPSQI